MFVEGVDLKGLSRLIRPGQALRVEVDGNLRARILTQLTAQSLAVRRGEPDWQNTILNAVAVMDVAETWGDNRTHAVRR